MSQKRPQLRLKAGGNHFASGRPNRKVCHSMATAETLTGSARVACAQCKAEVKRSDALRCLFAPCLGSRAAQGK